VKQLRRTDDVTTNIQNELTTWYADRWLDAFLSVFPPEEHGRAVEELEKLDISVVVSNKFKEGGELL